VAGVTTRHLKGQKMTEITNPNELPKNVWLSMKIALTDAEIAALPERSWKLTNTTGTAYFVENDFGTKS